MSQLDVFLRLGEEWYPITENNGDSCYGNLVNQRFCKEPLNRASSVHVDMLLLECSFIPVG